MGSLGPPDLLNRGTPYLGLGICLVAHFYEQHYLDSQSPFGISLFGLQNSRFSCGVFIHLSFVLINPLPPTHLRNPSTPLCLNFPLLVFPFSISFYVYSIIKATYPQMSLSTFLARTRILAETSRTQESCSVGLHETLSQKPKEMEYFKFPSKNENKLWQK